MLASLLKFGKSYSFCVLERHKNLRLTLSYILEVCHEEVEVVVVWEARAHNSSMLGHMDYLYLAFSCVSEVSHWQGHTPSH
jgi:hypothetical protein